MLRCGANLEIHGLTSMGGTLKNIGMGCAARAGKLAQHCDATPVFLGNGIVIQPPGLWADEKGRAVSELSAE